MQRSAHSSAPSLLSAATSCIKSSTCDNGGPLACLGSSIGKVTASAAQKTFADDYCASCSVVSGDVCTTAFYPAEGVPGVGVLLLPFGDGLVSAVDEACTTSKLGKTVCQSSFSTCVGVEAAKALAQSISVDSASCLVDAIKTGIASAGSGGDGGATEGGPGTTDGGTPGEDGGVTCNALVNSAPTIVSEDVTGTAPAPTGGTIADGTYYLQNVKNYGPAMGPISFKDTLVFSEGNKYEIIFLDDVATEPSTESAVFTAAGSTFTRSFTCPTKGETRVRQYSANAATFTLFVDKLVYQYTKQ